MSKELLTLAFYDDNGNRFEPGVEFTEDGIDNALVQHEYPYSNGADLEPMGLKARVVSLRVHFIGEQYEQHKVFLEWLEQSNAARKFVHPVYGLLIGDIAKSLCRHDDTLQHAAIDITFVENGATTALPVQKLAVTDAVNNAAVTGANNRLSWLQNALNNAQKTYASAKARISAYQNKIATASARFTATMSAVSNPATSFTSLLNWATSVPATLALSCAQAAERYSVAYKTLKSTPANFIGKLDSSLRALEKSFSGFGSGDAATTAAGTAVQIILKLTCAETLAVATADVFSQEQTLRATIKTAESVSPVDAAGNFVPQEADSSDLEVTALMSADELENTLALARKYLQEAIDCARANGLDPQSYKDMALALENHVNTIKLERETIKRVTLDQAMPLHLICLRHGLPYRAAERLMTLNPTMQNPNEAAGTLNIYEASNG